MTPADLLAEQFNHGTADDRAPVVLAPWTPAEQVQHIADALEVTRDQAVKLLAETRRVAPSRAVREAIIDDLPPDSRDHAIVIRAAGP
jgi:hypothetical protein